MPTQLGAPHTIERIHWHDATQQDGSYPRPQMLRPAWKDLCGVWEFQFGQVDGSPPVTFDHEIVVPFPPESPASGIHNLGFQPVVWYRRSIGPEDFRDAGISEEASRILLHFGAVDWSADVWINGQHVARHDDGQTPFTIDLTGLVDSAAENELLVRAVDDPHDTSILRGKQDWREDPHRIWYERTTGIWQPVWLECVPEVYVSEISWRTDPTGEVASLELTTNVRPQEALWVRLQLSFDGELLSDTRTRILDKRVTIPVHLARQRNGQAHHELLWSPENPRLIAAEITLEAEHRDQISSYLGIRTIGTDDRELLLNGRPRKLRGVLAQNYWPESHLAAPSAAAIRREVEMILALGFNMARIHQKAEDPRFLYWADRLGLLLWAETASAYSFDDDAMENLVSSWLKLVRRDRSHPSIITWVPMNESWGIHHIAGHRRQSAFNAAIAQLTRAADDSRPVVSNDGWEHTDSDLWTIHDYESDPQVLGERYASLDHLLGQIAGIGPAGRRLSIHATDEGQPIILSEFGGVSLRPDSADGWGYSDAATPVELEERVGAILTSVRASNVLAGFCYTQLTDTGLETNGLLYEDRSPKYPIETIRMQVVGDRPRRT